ncbi:MAG: glycine cleavage system protein GcvH [Clostridioides sp.]|jgi:glycine cleavage system H protein|nr:glycine cleavage system protein GcvH [Clostridioides sp.]
MKVLNGLMYTKDHEWVCVEGDKAKVGITDYAQSHLGDIVFVELPEIDGELGTGDTLAAVESVKAVSDAICPVSGTVVSINEALEDDPQLLNEDAYENWIAELELSDKEELKNLMSAEEYEEFIKEEE